MFVLRHQWWFSPVPRDHLMEKIPIRPHMRLMTQDDTQNECVCVCVGKQEVIVVMLQCHMFA